MVGFMLRSGSTSYAGMGITQAFLLQHIPESASPWDFVRMHTSCYLSVTFHLIPAKLDKLFVLN